MINTNELKIGDWVDVRNSEYIRYGKEPGYTLVDSINYSGINITSGYEGSIECEYLDQNLFGIPLTPEILEACGFEKMDRRNNTSLYKKWPISIVVNDDNVCEYMFLYIDDSSISEIDWIKKPNSLHQLQNLYFSLTGEELSVNLTQRKTVL